MISFNELQKGFIVGIIDNYGAVHSKFVKTNDDLSHESLFPSKIFKRWRWTYHNSLEKSVLSSDFDIEDWDKVERHITKKYRIKFWDNGYHDLDYFNKKLKGE